MGTETCTVAEHTAVPITAALALDLGCFQLWAIVNTAWMNIFPEEPFFPSDCFLRVNSETLTHMPSIGIVEPWCR